MTTTRRAAFTKALGHITVLDSAASRLAYERDANVLLAQAPALICIPTTPREVQDIVRACHQHHMAFTTRGAGTGLAAGSVPHNDECVMISTARLNAIQAYEPGQASVVVGAGVVNAALNRSLEPHGVMYAPDPSSQKACTLGGNWAANAGGVHCIGYGVTTDHILNLEVVTPQGQLHWLAPPETTGQPSAFAHAFNALMTGSEGTLGVITRARLKVTPMPSHVGVALLGFESVEAAMQAVSQTIAAGLAPKALEFMDAITVRCVNNAFQAGLPEAAQGVLLIELAYHYAAELNEAHTLLNRLIHQWQPMYTAWETAPQRRAKLWQARKGAVASYGQISPMFYVLDSVIPRNQLAYVLAQMQQISQRYALPIANVFHAGDGNLHPHLMFASKDAETTARVEQAASDIFNLCLEVGGVLSGEHGIGLEKVSHMKDQFDAPSLLAQQAIYDALDPQHLANPGKLVPAKGCCGESAHQQHSGDTTSTLRGHSPTALTDNDLWI